MLGKVWFDQSTLTWLGLVWFGLVWFGLRILSSLGFQKKGKKRGLCSVLLLFGLGLVFITTTY